MYHTELKEHTSDNDVKFSVLHNDQINSWNSCCKKIKQQTLEACIEKKKKEDIIARRAIEFHNAIGEMIAIDN